jgi:hypothetical protein
MKTTAQVPYNCFGYSQSDDQFASQLEDQTHTEVNKLKFLFSCPLDLDQMIQIPSQEFDMISAGSLDNSGDLFPEEKGDMGQSSLLCIESLFNEPSRSNDKNNESTHSSHSGSNLMRQISKSLDLDLWINTPTLSLPKVNCVSDKTNSTLY